MMKKSIIPSLLIIIGCSLLATVLLIKQQSQSNHTAKVYATTIHKSRPMENLQHSLTQKITVGAIGDILIHSPVYQDAFNGASYNFDPMFEDVKALLEKPDVLTANQESVLGGTELGLSSYPTFNSPHSVADALAMNGVDIVSNANNHSLDKGERGIQSEAAYLNAIGLRYVGSFVDEKDRETLRIIEKNGIKLAFLSYTYGTNGIPVPKGKDYLVNLINRDHMQEEIHRAKDKADVVVVSIHWGNEYQRIPNTDQKDLARFLAGEGADIIFGSHPHVLQPMEWIDNPDGRKTFVVYSLGNFISAQYGEYKDIGGMAEVEVTKQTTEQGSSVVLSNPNFYPTFVTRNPNRDYRVVPLESAGTFGLSKAEQKYQEIQQHMVQWLR
ncbi:CapA family protein [Bacillus sp. FJAT-29953]|nr:CapA family protein [Neobacillus sp. 114]MBU8917316.1 CapA family protein [Bacillus sp. FJAT-29953]